MNQGQLIELLLTAIPSPQAITNIALSEADAVRFDWRGKRFRVSIVLGVEEVQGGMLVCSDASILLRQCVLLSEDLRDARLRRSA